MTKSARLSLIEHHGVVPGPRMARTQRHEQLDIRPLRGAPSQAYPIIGPRLSNWVKPSSNGLRIF